MAGFINRLLGKGGPTLAKTRVAASDAAGNDNAPTLAESPDQERGPTGTAGSFVCREAVLDRKQRIAGYQFSLPEEVALRLQSDFEFLQKIYDDAVLRNLTSLGDDALLGPRLAFIRLSPDSLDNPRIHKLPKTNTVLMLAPAHQTLDAERIQRQLDVLRQAGIAYGWLLRHAQVAQFPQLSALAASADYVQVDATDFNGMDLNLLLKSLVVTRPANRSKLHLIAGGLHAFDEFHLYFQSGFDFFLGQFVTRRENWHPPKSNINRLRVIKLLNLLRSDAEVAAIAQELKHDPVLAFKLLRYINSPLMGLRTPITSMDQALILLGREKFYRWLSLMLFDFKSPGYNERVLTEQALSRAHFLESLADQGNLPAQADLLFILGLFSLLDLLMGQTMADLLLQAKLPAAIHDALLGRPCLYRNALLLAIAAEGQSPHDLEQQATLCGLEPLQVSKCAIHSLAWAHEISSLEAT
jgi:EAL and modified HD-GYP domain-containing signal transduction protein